MVAVKSSAIAAVGYHPESRTLAVKFQSGKTYRYADVPEKVHAGFAEAKSAGGYFAKNVAGKFKTA